MLMVNHEVYVCAGFVSIFFDGFIYYREADKSAAAVIGRLYTHKSI